MISQAVQDSINEQIKHEFQSAYVYLSMAAHCEAENLKGFAHWMRAQSREELSHAMKLFDYLNDRGGRVVLSTLEQPPMDFRSPLNLFEQVLEHERKVTKLIHNLYEVAAQEHDYGTQVALHWFIEEQVEEEKNAMEIVEYLKMIGNDSAALFLFDRQLGARTDEEG